MRVLMGELIISSKAGTTLPDALTLTSMVPWSTVLNTTSFSLTPVRITETSTLTATMTATPPMP